ncbi:MAG TPA: DUF402 domain-containing protein [Bacilli bacterium]|nr:DUF402 domain-containing protein [Bacilli bacterium]
MSINGKWIKIQSYKHDGRLHRFWRKSYVLEDNENWLVVASRRTQVIEGNGRKWFTKEPAVTFFNKKDWFNVIAMLKKEGIVYYTNIASPTLIDYGMAKYIDYDLDVKKFADGTIKNLDKNEFLRNIENYQYSNELSTIVEYKQTQVVDMMNNKMFPFCDEEVKKLYNRFIEETKVKQ